MNDDEERGGSGGNNKRQGMDRVSRRLRAKNKSGTGGKVGAGAVGAAGSAGASDASGAPSEMLSDVPRRQRKKKGKNETNGSGSSAGANGDGDDALSGLLSDMPYKSKPRRDRKIKSGAYPSGTTSSSGTNTATTTTTVVPDPDSIPGAYPMGNEDGDNDDGDGELSGKATYFEESTQEEGLGYDQGIPLAAKVATEDEDKEMQDKIRNQILSEAVRADTVTPVNEDDEEPKGLSAKKKCFILLALVLLVAGVSVGVAVPLSRNGGGDGKTSNGTPNPTTSPAPTSLSTISVALQLDVKPEETSWRLDCPPSPISVPVGTYRDSPNQLIVVEEMFVVGQTCDFTLFDAGGDGLEKGSYVHLYYGFYNEGAGGPFATISGNFGTSTSVQIEVQTYAPTSSPAPSISHAPTSTPPVPVTIALQLDDLPDETGWSLTCGNETLVNYTSKTYSQANQLVQETFWVEEDNECLLTLTDANEDGIGCHRQCVQDAYQVYLSDRIVSGALLLSGAGNFRSIKSIPFIATSFIAPTAAPTITTAPTSTLAPSFVEPHVNFTWSEVHGDLVLGNPVVMSADGNVVAFGLFLEAQQDSIAQVHRYNEVTGSWGQIGQGIGGFVGDAVSAEIFLALSGDGTTLAVGRTRTAFDSGSLRIFRYVQTGNLWMQIGRELDGERDQDEIPTPISLSFTGNTIVVGQRYQDIVQVYQYEEGADWVQVGETIHRHSSSLDSIWFGNAVSISDDGQTVVIGAPFDGEDVTGFASVFRYSGDAWQRLGDIFKGTDYSESGTAVAMSGDGSTMAFAGYYANTAQVFRYIAGEWVQVGEDITAADNSISFAYSLDLSFDGNAIAVGAYFAGVFQFEFIPVLGVWVQNGPLVPGQGISVAMSSNAYSMILSKGSIVRREYPPEPSPFHTLTGSVPEQQFGHAVSISGDGTILAIGSGSTNYQNWTVTVFSNDGNGQWTETGLIRNEQLVGVGNRFSMSLSGDGQSIAVGIPDMNEVLVFRAAIEGSWSKVGETIAGPLDNGFGEPVILSDDGSTVAVGGGLEELFTSPGDINVYSLQQATSYTQLGDTIGRDIEASWGYRGRFLFLSGDGKTVVITGDFENDGGKTNLVRVYTLEGGNWAQLGADLPRPSEEYGSLENSAVVLSSDGRTIAAGSSSADTRFGFEAGVVLVYTYSSSSWKQKGSAIVGEYTNEAFGAYLDISGDGNVLVISAIPQTFGSPRRTRLFRFVNGDWQKIGDDIVTSQVGSSDGVISVALSSDGSTLAIGEKVADDGGSNVGRVLILNVNDW